MQLFNGNLSQLGIWNKVLSQTEVNEIYNSGNPINLLNHSAAANLLHFYKMDTFPNILDEQDGNDGVCFNMGMINLQGDAP